jgi:phage-related protein
MNAEVLVKFTGDTKDLDSKTKTAQSTLKGFASGVGTAFKAAGVAIATATIAVGNLVKKSVEAYAEFEQLEGGLEAMFGKGSQEMQNIMQKSEEAWKNLTMSQNEYLNAFERSYPLVNAGLSENADSIEYTNKVLQLTSDLFNTYGGSVEYYQNAINWALKGSFVYLDNLNLGIKGTQEGFIEAANASGVLGRTIQSVSELTNDEIIDVIMHYADSYGVLGRTAEEAGGTILGSLNMVKASWQNFVLGMSKSGDDLNKLIDNLVKSIVSFAGNIVPVIVRALQGIAKALPGIANQLAEMLPTIINDILPSVLEAIIQLAQAIVQAIPNLINTLLPPLIDGVLQILQGLIQALPGMFPTLAQGIIALVRGIVQILPQLVDMLFKLAIEIVMALAEALPELLPQIVDAIMKIIPVIIENLPLFIKAGIELLLGLLKGLIMAIPQIIKNIPAIVQAILDTFKSLFSKIFDVGKDLVKGLWNGIKNVSQWIIDKIKGFGKSVMNAIKGIFGVHSPSTEFEWVGKMNVLGLEKGMEELQPQLQRTIDGMFNLQPNVSGSMSNTFSPQMNVVVQNNMELDPLGQVVNQIKTFSGGAKNDYNWGATL